MASVDRERSRTPTKEDTSADKQRGIYVCTAASDPVEDYRALANAKKVWADDSFQVPETDRPFRYLDVCCGTGRWSQAFSERVLKPRGMRVEADFVDLCSESLASLEDRLAHLPEFETSTTHCMDAGKLSTLKRKYDLVVNMHGLYAVPKESLHEVVAAMFNMVAPGGRLVISLGDRASFYWRYARVLVDAAGTQDQTPAEDVEDVLKELGISYDVERVNYVEEVQTGEGLRHFLENECGGNTWPVNDEKTDKATGATTAPEVQALIEPHRVSEDLYRFPQTTPVLVAHRKPSEVNLA